MNMTRKTGVAGVGMIPFMKPGASKTYACVIAMYRN
jgi:hypothetical protein